MAEQEKKYLSSAKGFSFGRKQKNIENQAYTPRKFYDTISEEVELDPEIAADLLIYIDSY